jgi:hypothetical protein
VTLAKVAGRGALAALLLAGLQACASPRARCGLVACGVERDALLQVTAEQLNVPASALEISDIRHYPEATVAWRVRRGGRAYQCREARDSAAPSHVRFVYCRPAT